MTPKENNKPTEEKKGLSIEAILKVVLGFVLKQLLTKDSFFNRVIVPRLRKRFGGDDPGSNEHPK